jgi:hypothetical protein
MRTFLRRSVRRDPLMSHRAVPLNVTFDGLLMWGWVAALGGIVLVLLGTSPAHLTGTMLGMPVGKLHNDGVRHRWWALAVGAGAAFAVGLPLRAALDGWGHWGTFVATLLGGVAGNVAHTAVTHVPRGLGASTAPSR